LAHVKTIYDRVGFSSTLLDASQGQSIFDSFHVEISAPAGSWEWKTALESTKGERTSFATPAMSAGA
jgi:hypothetical protein